jgi:hypothetical protein
MPNKMNSFEDKPIKSIIMKIILLLLVVWMPIFVFSQDFRNSNFGDSKELTKTKEKQKLVFENNEMLAYKDVFNGFDVHVLYVFSDDNFEVGRYAFIDQNKTTGEYLEVYESYLKHLYESPTSKDTLWFNDEYKNQSNLSLALEKDHVVLESHYNKNEVEIILQLLNNNNAITLFVNYTK